MNKDSKIYIAGHKGMVGSALLRKLEEKGYRNFILRRFDELDLTRQDLVEVFFEREKPGIVFDAAAKVGGIVANNTYRAEFLYQNLMIQNNLIHAAWKFNVKKLLFLGSSCIYPRMAPQPLKEEYLLTGPLEFTNEPYAIAKIAGIKMCESYYRQYGSNFISVMPTNLYGPNDNFDLQTSHVLPALIRRIHLAKCLMEDDWDSISKDFSRNPVGDVTGSSPRDAISKTLTEQGITGGSRRDSISVTLWGTGTPLREFMHVNDMAGACIHLMETLEAKTLYEDLGQTHVNIGTGAEISIAELAEMIAKIVGFKGEIKYDRSKPDGTPRKLMDVGLLRKTGFSHTISLEKGIREVYQWYIHT
ncbi:MAG: GDP-L-fucose synthase [Bacteroidales bacterium]|nr:GDP-L-fucose synthase [Bacteroidales bacterium]